MAGCVSEEFLRQLSDENVAVRSLFNRGAMTNSGVTTLTGGLSISGRFRVMTVPVGGAAYSSTGTSAVHVAGTVYVADIYVPRNFTVTGVGVLNGATVGTDNLIVSVYSSDGTLLGNSALAGTLSAGANAFQEIALTSPVAIVGPGRYWIGVQCNGTTATTRRVAASTFIDVLTKSTAGTFGTLPALTVPTTFTADVGPIAYIY